MAEKLQSEVELHDVDLGALQLLVEYSYTGQVHITDENVQVFNIILGYILINFNMITFQTLSKTIINNTLLNSNFK